MGFLDDIVDLLCPVVEDPSLARGRQQAGHAVGYLAPKFGVEPALPELCIGAKNRCSSYRRWGRVDGREAIIARRYVVMVEPDADRETYGEEIGHYLHLAANPVLNDAIHFDFKPSTRSAALEFTALKNWEECIGRYAGLVYARYCGDHLETVRSRYESHIRVLQGRLSWDSDEEEWGTLTHLPGYCAADDLLAADPWGKELTRLARVPPAGIAAEARKLKGWQDIWPYIERHAPEAERLVRKYIR